MSLPLSQHLPVRNILYARVIAIACVVFASLVLLGWTLNIGMLKSILPSLASMKVNTALCFILSGFSIILISKNFKNDINRKIKIINSCCAGILVLFALSTLIEYMTNINLGVDNFLLEDSDTRPEDFPGRMSQGTAINFLILGCCLFLLQVKNNIRLVVVTQICALILLFLSIIALVSYIYDYTSLYAIRYYQTMALHTSIMFVLLGSGVLAVVFNSGITSIISSQYIGAKVARTLLLLAIILPILLGGILTRGIGLVNYDPAFGIAVFTLLNILVSMIIIMVIANWLYRTDQSRTRILDVLNTSNISLRKSEEGIKRLNRVYAVLSGINNLIVRTRDQKTLFDESCKIAIEKGLFRMAWIGMLSTEQNELVVQAISGHDEDYLKHLPLTADTDNSDSLALGAKVLNTMRHEVVSDILEADAPWKTAALNRGYRSAASFPLIVADKAIGSISFYASESEFFDEAEVKLLNELASDISFAMEFIDNERQINYLAYHDPLTNLSNRSALHKRLGQLISRKFDVTNPLAHPFALILININSFRNINDTLGHNNGDELIKQVGARLKSAIWETDIVANLGGDDFAVLLPRLANKEHIDVVANKIDQEFNQSFNILDIPINVEITMGIALFPDHGDSGYLLWQHADIALRYAKETFKPLQFYDSQINHYDPQQLILIGELREAIDRNQLVLHYQPKISLKEKKVIGVEALVRWQHPDIGLIYPDKFIPAVENTGLIDSLTIWVLANALRQVYFWRKSGIQLNLSINLSVRNLQNPNIKSDILDLLQSSRFPMENLILEITESAIMVDPLHAKEILMELKKSGMIISIDDFGIGQTSLNYLKELPVDQMKIDKSFVMEIEESSNKAIVHSAIELGYNLDLSVTAEGIENERAFEILKSLNCEYGQGYYFSKPLPPDEFIKWLENSSWR